MRKIAAIVFGLGAVLVGHSANAITVDGVKDPDYGTQTGTVTYSAVAPENNFSAATPFTDALGYNVYLKDTGGMVYGFLEGNGLGTPVGEFANLYFGDGTRGSVIGFEVTNQRAFTPGVSGYQPAPITYAISGNNIEFSLPESVFEAPVGNLMSAGFNPGDTVSLRLSQSFGYSVGGGALYPQATRLGAFTLSGGATAVPGPIAGAGLVPILGLAGAWFVRRRKQLAA